MGQLPWNWYQWRQKKKQEQLICRGLSWKSGFCDNTAVAYRDRTDVVIPLNNSDHWFLRKGPQIGEKFVTSLLDIGTFCNSKTILHLALGAIVILNKWNCTIRCGFYFERWEKLYCEQFWCFALKSQEPLIIDQLDKSGANALSYSAGVV